MEAFLRLVAEVEAGEVVNGCSGNAEIGGTSKFVANAGEAPLGSVEAGENVFDDRPCGGVDTTEFHDNVE